MEWEKREAKRGLRGIVACQELVKHGSQAIDICLGSCLCSTVLFWCGIAGGTQGFRINGLTRFAVTGNAEVNEIEMSSGRAHNIGWFEIAEDDRRLASVQVVEHCAELDANINDLLSWKASIHCFVQVPLQRFALDEVCHEIPVLRVGKVVVQARKVGMRQAREYEHLTVECR